MIDVRVIDVQPHPDQATNNPGCWAVQFRVTHTGRSRTFWRWHTLRKLNANGAWVDPGNAPPSHEEILERFWNDTFGELHGFSFSSDAAHP